MVYYDNYAISFDLNNLIFKINLLKLLRFIINLFIVKRMAFIQLKSIN